jgi:hypothetical protein
LEESLANARQAQLELENQKQENLVLKDTIDRMKYEMEEMRTSSTSGHSASGVASARNTISRSLGAELAGKLKDTDWDVEDDPEEQEEESEAISDEDAESEDIVQTIITRTKRVTA